MRKEIKLVLLSVFLLVFGTYISGFVITPYAKELGASWFIIGLLPGIMYVVRLLIGTPVGILAEKKGSLKVLKYSLALYPFIALAYAMSDTIPALMGARLLHGVASAMMLPIAMAYIGQITPKGKEGRYMSVFNAILFFASGFGPITASYISSYFNYRSTFYTLFLLAAVSLGIILFSTKSGTVRSDSPKPLTDDSEEYKNPLIKNPGLLGLSAVNIALAIIQSLIEFFFVAFPMSRGVSLIATGSIVAVYNIFSGVIQIPLGRLSDAGNKFAIILIAGVAAIASLLFLPFTHSALTMLPLLLVLALATAVILSSCSALSTILGREAGMCRSMGFLQTANSLGMIIGGVLLGTVSGFFGLDSVFYFCGFATFLCLLIFTFLWLRFRAAAKKSIKIVS